MDPVFYIKVSVTSEFGMSRYVFYEFHTPLRFDILKNSVYLLKNNKNILTFNI